MGPEAPPLGCSLSPLQRSGNSGQRNHLILEIYNILQTIIIKQIYFRACDMIWVTDFNHKLPFLNFQVRLQSIYCSHLTNPSAVGFAKSGAQAAQVDPGRMIGKLHAVLQLGKLTHISPIWLMLQVKWG